MARLLIRPGAIGDVILSLPALESACDTDTEVWVPRPLVPLIRFTPKVRALSDTGLDWIGVVEDHRAKPALASLARFESIYSWYGTNHPEFRHAVRHLPFTFFPALPPPPGIPVIDAGNPPRSDFAVVHPFASSPAKRWPLDLFRQVAAALPRVEWCAGPEEDLAAAVRIPDLYELAQWLAGARVYIGNDSGIAHLAAGVGTPVVAIFLSTDPAVWAPRGRRVTVLERPAVKQVVAAARAYLR